MNDADSIGLACIFGRASPEHLVARATAKLQLTRLHPPWESFFYFGFSKPKRILNMFFFY